MSEKQQPLDLAAKTAALAQRLQAAGIDTSQWGVGAAKTVEHLAKELIAGDCYLEADEQGQLLRTVRPVGADVFYRTAAGRLLRLREDRQVFTDGRVRRRNMNTSVNEKIQPDEIAAEAAARGIIRP